MNIVEPIFVQCRKAGGARFVRAGNRNKYGQLWPIGSLGQQCLPTCYFSRSHTPESGRDIHWRPDLHAIVLIALTRLGIVTISGREQKFSWRFAVDAVVSDQPFQFPAGRVILASIDWMAGDGHALEQAHFYRSAPDELCRIFLTSGTTGEEKGVAVTHRMIATRIDRQNLFSVLGRRLALGHILICH